MPRCTGGGQRATFNSFHHVGPRDGTLVSRVGSLYPLSCLPAQPQLLTQCLHAKPEESPTSQCVDGIVDERHGSAEKIPAVKCSHEVQEIKTAKKKKCVFPFRDTFPAVECHSHPREEDIYTLNRIHVG